MAYLARAVERAMKIQEVITTPSLRVRMIGEFMTAPQASPYGAAGLLTCQPAFAAEFAGRLKELVGGLVERLRATRMRMGEAIDTPGLFFAQTAGFARGCR